jgi:hypothetical protein
VSRAVSACCAHSAILARPSQRRSASLKSKTHVLSGACPSVYDELVISGSAGCISEALNGALPLAGGPSESTHHFPLMFKPPCVSVACAERVDFVVVNLHPCVWGDSRAFPASHLLRARACGSLLPGIRSARHQIVALSFREMTSEGRPTVCLTVRRAESLCSILWVCCRPSTRRASRAMQHLFLFSWYAESPRAGPACVCRWRHAGGTAHLGGGRIRRVPLRRTAVRASADRSVPWLARRFSAVLACAARRIRGGVCGWGERGVGDASRERRAVACVELRAQIKHRGACGKAAQRRVCH